MHPKIGNAKSTHFSMHGNRFYPQTTAVISAWFVDRYFDQKKLF